MSHLPAGTATTASRLSLRSSTTSTPTSSPLLLFSPSYPTKNDHPQSQPPPSTSPPSGPRVSDEEYQVRLGRAVSLLRATLEDFMRIGLVDYDSSNVAGSSSNSGLGLPALDRLGLGAILEALGASGRSRRAQTEILPPHLRNHEEHAAVYHPHIVFKFRPPTATTEAEGYSSPAEAANDPLIRFSGRSLYFASAHVLRHALSALFSETRVSIESIKLHKGKDAGGDAESAPPPPANQSTSTPTTSAGRPATLLIRLSFSGAVRVTHQIHDYTVIFLYRFDEDTGMIVEHKVERIEPAPGKKIWAGLTAAFARLAGFQPQGASTAAPSGCQQMRAPPTTTKEQSRDSTRGSVPAPVPVTLPLSRQQQQRKQLPSEKLQALQRQRRRSYATQSGKARQRSTPPASVSTASSAARATTTTTSSSSSAATASFFSHPRGAQDMPGPSLSSILVPSWRGGEPTASAAENAAVTPRDRSAWAPSSDDPNVVRESTSTGASARMPAFNGNMTPADSRSTLTRTIVGLSKSNLTVLVTLTGMAGYALCPSELVALSSTAALLGGPVGTLLAFATGTAACSAAANAINQLREIPYDAQMARTRNRLLPSRTITPLQAAAFATAAGTSGVATLALLNPLTAALGALNIYLYAFVYTPMKRRHIANTWVGAVVGALPPLMGWAACTGTLHLVTDAPAWCLAALLFAWQFPHFNSLSHNLSSEYARGGYRMMSVTNPALNRRTSLRYALSLLPICSVALPLSGAVSPWAYAILSLPPNCLLVAAAFQFWRQGTEKSARWCFWVSLIHLPAVMVLAMMTKKSLVDAVIERVWGLDEEEEEGSNA